MWQHTAKDNNQQQIRINMERRNYSLLISLADGLPEWEVGCLGHTHT